MFDTRSPLSGDISEQRPDEYTYRDPHLSMWQSAASFVVSNTPDALLHRADVRRQRLATALMAPVHAVHRVAQGVKQSGRKFSAVLPDFSALDTVGDCAKLVAQLLWAELIGDDDTVKRLEEELRYSVCNLLGWAECVAQYALYKASFQSNPYRKNVDFVGSISDPTTIAILGDWGTGDAIALNLLNQVKSFGPEFLIHLGDIYYSGTDFETTHNFLQICRTVLGPKFPLYSLCGNHDMYSGGAPYYRLVDILGQKASYFSLRNDYWQIVATDTGNNDQNPLTVSTNMTTLNNSEIPWALDKIKDAGGRRTVVLSHHQLFSPFASVGSVDGVPYCFNPNLYSIFKDVIPNIDVWFWGHEHTLAVYDPYMGLSRGRCVGCSAIPVFTDQQSYAADKSLKTIGGNLPSWVQTAQLRNNGTDYNHAFAILTLQKSGGSVDYYEVPFGENASNKLFSEKL